MTGGLPPAGHKGNGHYTTAPAEEGEKGDMVNQVIQTNHKTVQNFQKGWGTLRK